MIKYLVLIFATLLLFAFSFFPEDEVSVKHDIPNAVAAGTELTVAFTVNKSIGIQFGKLQIEYPEGITASEMNSKGGQFSATSTGAKIIWMQFPNENELVIQLKLKFSEGLSGTKTIHAKFQYVAGNEKKSVEIPAHEITINNSNKEDTASTTKKDTAANFNTPENTPSQVTVTRSIQKDEKTGLFTVNISIRKEAVKGFAKYTDVLPEGVVAMKGTASGNGSFKFAENENKANIIWATLPSSEEIQATYFIKVIAPFNQNPLIKGSFSYLEDESTRKVIPNDAYLDVASPTNETIANNEKQEEKTQTDIANNAEKTSDESNTVVKQTQEENKEKSTEITNQAVETTIEKSETVNFHVQIGAFKNRPSVQYFEKKYHLGETILTDMDKGLNKYMVGKFNEYKLARDHREKVKEKGINDAFVTAYNSGKRITVQEALMLLNQKWYK